MMKGMAMTHEANQSPIPNGSVAAALVAAGFGCATLGMATTWAESSPEAADALNWWPPAGPLTGKAGTATAVFFASWCVLHLLWRRRTVPIRPIAVASALLLGVGLVGTFPPFFQSNTRRGDE
jgi:hypothetical protein